MPGRHGQYPPELRERAVRLVAECRPDHASEWEAMRSVAQKLGIGTTETVRKWVRRAEVDAGTRPGVTSEESAELRRLKAEVKELRRANEILKAAAVKSTGQRNTFTILEVCGGEAGPAGHERPVSRAVMGDVGCGEVVQRDFEGDRLSAWFDLHGDQADRGLRSGAA